MPPVPDLQRIETVTDWLCSLRNRSSKFGLERMLSLAEAAGHPEKALPSIHIAGTNGKGSTAAMLEALYRSNGYRVGLYTSPHVHRLNERIQIDRKPISDATLCKQVRRLYAIAEPAFDAENFPSFFEWITLIAFQYFNEQGIDLAIIETGFGGRLDATNILVPHLSIITSIGKDHTDILGDSLPAIAREKAGILKRGVPALIGEVPKEAETVIAEYALQNDCPLHRLADAFEDRARPQTNLVGSYQQHNAALAVRATELLAETFPIRGTHALKSIRWPGRWERRSLGTKTLILDATHNAEAGLQLAENLEATIKVDGRKPLIITGILGEERAQALLPILSRYARELYLLEPKQPRACSVQTLTQLLTTSSPNKPIASSVQTLFSCGKCHIGDDGDTLVVTGSIYLIAEILNQIDGKDPDPIGQDLI